MPPPAAARNLAGVNIGPVGIVLIIAAVAGVIYLIVRAAKAHAERERQRKAALAGWAAANGFQFHPNDPWNLDARYRGVADIGRGHDRYALEVLTREQPVPSALFRYHYMTWETRTVTRNGRSETERYEETHWRRYLIAEVGGQFPNFALRPEAWFDKVAGFVGFEDIDFESEDFSKRFHCKSDDRQFAYALVHPQMMDWMLQETAAGRGFTGELRNGLLVMDLSSQPHTAEGCQTAWSQAAAFINRIPPFVWQDYGKRDAFQLPDPVAYVPPAPPPSPAPGGEAQPS